MNRKDRSDAIAMAALERLAAHLTFGAPDAEGFTPVTGRLPPRAVDALAALGADAEDMEPSLGSGKEESQDPWTRHVGVFAGMVVDGEVDAGEDAEEDPADPSQCGLGDDAEHGIADQDALELFNADANLAKAFATTEDERRAAHRWARGELKKNPKTKARLGYDVKGRFW